MYPNQTKNKEPIIELNNVSFSYDSDHYLLKNISCSILEGEFILLTGPSGGGKTTLTRVINGIIPYFFGGERSGTVQVQGTEISEQSSWELAEILGSVFQDPRSQFFAPIVKDEIAFFCENYSFPSEEIKKRVTFASEELGIQHLLKKEVIQLSSGEKQKVAVASIRVANQKIYVLDEPSANLDSQATLELQSILMDWKKAGHTIIIAEHRLYYLSDLIDRAFYLKNGLLEHIFTKDEWQNLTQAQLKKYGLRSPVLHWDDSGCSPISLQSSASVNKIEVEQLSIGFPKSKKNIGTKLDFQLKSGEVVALIGGNGVGKTTLAKTLSGLMKEKAGTIRLNQQKIATKKRSQLAWYVMQEADYQLFSASVLEELMIGKKRTPELKNKAEEVLKALDLWSVHTRHPASLSGGQKQRLTIGVALMQEVPLVILDEPTAGLDGGNLHRIVKVIEKQAALGTIFLMISHDFELINQVAQRVLVLKDGHMEKDYILTSERSQWVLQDMLG